MHVWLSRFIEEVRVITPNGRPVRIERLPDGRMTLIIRVLESKAGDVSVHGAQTSALFKYASGFVRAVAVQLKPGWAMPLFGVPATELTNRITPLDELWNSSDQTEKLLAARSVPEMVSILSDEITARSHHAIEPASARLARHAIRLFERDDVRVDQVASKLGVTARHLRRAFADNVGISPKEFARTVRLQRAVRSMATLNDWGQVATHAGYYDQAHLIADFRQLVGLTPGAFLKRAQQ